MTRRITVRSGAIPRKVIPPASAAVRGPIEPTFLVAASNARADLIAVADYVCDGIADEVQINAAFTAIAASSSDGGIVQLTGGTFYCSDQIVITSGSKAIWLRGVGRNATRLETSDNAPFTRSGFVEMRIPNATITDIDVSVYNNGYVAVIDIDPLGNSAGTLARVTAYMGSPSAAVLTRAINIGNDMTLTDVEVGNSSKGDGIVVESARVNIDGAQIHSATTDGGGTGWGIAIATTNANNCRIHNAYTENCAGTGIWIGSDNCIINGNDVLDGIIINGTADGTVVGGNIGTITDNGTNTVNTDTDADAIHDNVDGEIALITEKVSPVGADFLIIEDSAAANVKKSMTVAALEAVLSHDNIADVSVDDHHAQAHNVASHSDTTATGAELETLTDGSNADSLHAHAGTTPALDDITDVTITAVATNEVLAKSAGDWINRTLTEAGIAAESHGSHDHDTPIATHAAITTAHHTKYTDAEAASKIAADDLYVQTAGDTMGGALNMGNQTLLASLDPTLGTHIGDRDYNDGRYDAAGTAAGQDHDHATPIATHAAITTAHHTKYTDAEAAAKVAADDLYLQTAGDTMGGALNMGNQTLLAPLDPTLGTHVGDRDFNDGRYDAAGTAAGQDHDHATPIATHAALPNAHHNEAHTIVSHSDTTATGAELETLTDGSETALHSHAGAAGAAFSELLLIGA